MDYSGQDCSVALWKFVVYCPPGGSCPFEEWCLAQDEDVRALCMITLGFLEKESDWHTRTNKFKPLWRAHRGLGEIRFLIPGAPVRRFRPLGIWPPRIQREFVLLTGCEKPARGQYVPANALELALHYRSLLADGIGGVRGLRI